LALETPQRTPDGGGGGVVTWTTTATVWADIQPAHGRERVIGEQRSGEITHEITIRHRPGITPAMRFRLGARLFQIIAVRDIDESRRILRCQCQEELL
ncbi:MAG: phage head closure protein, partial [Hyphomicrobiaceae bacterium]